MALQHRRFLIFRRFRGAVYRIAVQNPQHICKGVQALFVNGAPAARIPCLAPGQSADVTVVMGPRGAAEKEDFA